MFAMFHLGRPDIFPLGDLAVRKGLIELYKLKVTTFAAVKPSMLDVFGSHVGQALITAHDMHLQSC